MQNTMTTTLKALVSQVSNASRQAIASTAPAGQDMVRIADVRRAAEDAKDTLRHRFSS